MSKKHEITWSALPHTLAKVAILRSYLEKWFVILGLTFSSRDLWYIDGFAGPGEYRGGHDGSPIAAINAARSALRAAEHRWKAREIRCLFIEEDTARFRNLTRCLEQCPISSRIHIKAAHTTFADGINELRNDPENPFRRGDPLFAFIDPFGASAMPFGIVRDLLSNPTAEVLINLDSDGVNRIYAAGTRADHERILTDLYGDDSWKSLRSMVRNHDRMQAILALYKAKLREIVRYTFSFEMRSAASTIDYHLVFASQHALGLEKMKESMRQLDQDGSYKFCDEEVGQSRLFKFDDPAEQAERMFEKFRGSEMSYRSVNHYALTESPFINAKSMLKELESRKWVEVTADGPRRKGTFPEHLNIKVRFRNGNPCG